MRLNWKALLPSLLVILTTSCFDKAPVYSVVPTLEFSSVCFSEGLNSATGSSPDTLSLSLKFRDGDGDLGLSASAASDNDIPYNEKYYYRLSSGTFLNYKAKRTNPNYDTLPEFVTPFNCTNWEVITDGNKTSPKVLDTLYIKYNPSHFNIFIDFYVKNNDGTFTKYDFTKAFVYPNCSVGGFNGRFPILANDLSKKSPLEGILNYKMKSLGLKLTFSIKTIKLRIQIYDRALNKSNELFTPEFTLPSVKCN